MHVFFRIIAKKKKQTWKRKKENPTDGSVQIQVFKSQIQWMKCVCFSVNLVNSFGGTNMIKFSPFAPILCPSVIFFLQIFITALFSLTASSISAEQY